MTTFKISYDAKGNAIEESYESEHGQEGGVQDTSLLSPYTEEEIAQAIPTVPAHFVKDSIQQKELRDLSTRQLKLMNDLNERTDKYDDATGERSYARMPEQRRVLQIQIDGLERSRALQTEINQRSLATAWLDKQHEVTSLRATAAAQAAHEQLVQDMMAQEAAKEEAARRRQR